jgi:hypothetical protein
MEIFIESSELETSSGVKMFQEPKWDVIHPDFSKLFGLRVAEKMGKNAFLMDISKICPNFPIATLVRISGKEVLALSPGTLEARKTVLDAYKASIPTVSATSVVEETEQVQEEVSEVVEETPKKKKRVSKKPKES